MQRMHRNHVVALAVPPIAHKHVAWLSGQPHQRFGLMAITNLDVDQAPFHQIIGQSSPLPPVCPRLVPSTRITRGWELFFSCWLSSRLEPNGSIKSHCNQSPHRRTRFLQAAYIRLSLPLIGFECVGLFMQPGW